ncbi:MAG: phosphodiester glycosidase family protein [Phycisphaerae bacterium]|nr:phosphodiester glycosidase family protein [Phycisphaerae bacterium]MDD5239987.1 phosphodiester glycosidase family protein [Candidatus Nanoarchaeia archaeon]
MIYEFDPKKYRFAVEIGEKGKLERLDKIPRPKPGEKVACAINWSVFDWSGNANDGYGEVEQDGVQLKPESKAFPSMSFKYNKLTFGNLLGAQMGVSTAMTLVLNGKIDIRNPAKMSTGSDHRTACGQRKNGNILFVTMENVTSKDLAEQMLALDCTIAFQGDSGGSTGYYNGELYDHGRAIAGALVAYEIDVDYWLDFSHSWQDRIYPDLAYAIAYMAYKKNKKALCTSGFRSAEEQLASQKSALKKKGYYQTEDGRVYNSKGQCMVSAVGESSHNWGMAFDSRGTWLEDMSNSELKKYGLRKPMSYEPWHVELDKRTTVPEKKVKFYKYMKEAYPMDAKTFQMITGLKPDGVVGKATLAKMREVKELINKYVKG